MNEQIKEFARTSHLDVYGLGKDRAKWEATIEKFAELIVRECLDVMSKTSEEANKRFTYMGDDVPTVVHQMRIEEHFGVKE